MTVVTDIIPCRMCGNYVELSYDSEAYDRWQNGTYIQDAFPEMSASDREMLKTHTCGTCWDSMLSGDDEDPICPRCGVEYAGFPALSRLDNKTNICSDCGMDEAMQDFTGVPLTDFLSESK